MITEDTIIYLCECNKMQTREDMRRESDFGYDQLVCTDCGDVLIDDLHGKIYVKEVNKFKL